LLFGSGGFGGGLGGCCNGCVVVVRFFVRLFFFFFFFFIVVFFVFFFVFFFVLFVVLFRILVPGNFFVSGRCRCCYVLAYVTLCLHMGHIIPLSISLRRASSLSITWRKK